MQIEKINENQLHVILDLNDLEQHHITAHSFMCNSTASQDLCFKILSFANTEIGFDLKNHEIIMEAFSVLSHNSFVLVITRIPKAKYLHQTKTKTRFTIAKSLLIKFNNFEEFCMFCNSLKNNFKQPSSLYLLDDCYFLHIKFNNLKDYFKIQTIAHEFSSNIYNCDFIIDENAEFIIKNCAIEMCKRYFI